MFELGKTYRDEKVPTKTKWVYSVSGLGRDAAYCIVASFLIIFITEAGIFPKANYTAMMGVLTGLIIGYRIFDGLNDPFMGVIIEKTHFRLGKYKPWIFIGSLSNIVCILALFCAPTAFSWLRGWAYVGWFAVFYLLWGMTFTINDISFWGMLPSMSKDEKEKAKVTSLLLIFCYVGSFIVAAGMPYLSKQNVLGKDAYWIMAIVIGVLFVLSQTCVFLFCKEHERDKSDDKEGVRFRDMIKVLKDNDQVRLMILALFCYFFSTSIFNALMQNVFYITIGYNAGKSMMTVFNAVNNIAMIIPSFFMPALIKKFPKKGLFKFFYGVMIIGLIAFFLYGMPIGNTILSPAPYVLNADGVRELNASYAILYSLITTIVFVCQGAAYTIIIIMMTDCIEYNQYKTGSRKEAVIFSLRPLTTKLASSIQQGVTTLSLMGTGVMGIMSEVSRINEHKATTKAEEIAQAIELDKIVATANMSQVWGLKICCVLIPTLLAAICWFLLVRFYKIDEDFYAKICKANKGKA